ncbi:MAG: hypothetical protein U0869_00755 [Chloroflexota bacterium]
MAAPKQPIVGQGAQPATPWTWPHPTLPNRWNATVTEVLDLASDGRRVAVIEGAIWPPVGAPITVHEDDDHVRTGTVARVELSLGFRQPAKVLIFAELARDPA